MQLSNCQIRPGKVIQVVDGIGTIKAESPELFLKDNPDLLPDIVPFFTLNDNSFTNPKVGDDIWILIDENNPRLLYYFRQNGIATELAETLKNKHGVEVLTRKVDKNGTEIAELMLTDEDGWTILHKNSYMQIIDGNIKLATKSGTVEIDGGGNITFNGGSEPAVLGQKLTDTLTSLDTLLKNIASAAQGSPYTVAIASAIQSGIPDYESKYEKIQSEKIKLA